MTIQNRITAELNRQHTTLADFCEYTGISKKEFEHIETLSANFIVKAAEFLGCTCNYIFGLSEDGSPTLKDDKRIGFTPLQRITKLFKQMNEPQQLELLDLVCDYSRKQGITYTRPQAEQERAALTDELIFKLSKLSKLSNKT